MTEQQAKQCSLKKKVAGSQREESHPWQGHAAEALMGKANQASGFSPVFPEHVSPKNKNLPALLYSSTFLTLSGKS